MGGSKGTLSGPAFDACLDNMQKATGPPGLYGCHRGTTQQWEFRPSGQIRSAYLDACIGLNAEVRLAACAAGDLEYTWRWDGPRLIPAAAPELCLQQAESGAD